jgi:hypothetical protein
MGGWGGPTSHNANQGSPLQLGIPAASIPWHDGRQSPSAPGASASAHQDQAPSRSRLPRGGSRGRTQVVSSGDRSQLQAMKLPAVAQSKTARHVDRETARRSFGDYSGSFGDWKGLGMFRAPEDVRSLARRHRASEATYSRPPQNQQPTAQHRGGGWTKRIGV